MRSFQSLQRKRLQHYSDIIRVILLTVIYCIALPVSAAGQPPKILSVKVPTSIDVGELFEVEIKVLDESGLDRIQVEFLGKISRIRGRGKKSYTFKAKFKSSQAGRKTMKVTAINLQKLKSNVYRKRINVQALKEPVQKKNNVSSKSSIGKSKNTVSPGKVIPVKPVIASKKLNSRNGGQLVGKSVAPTMKQKPSGLKMQPLVASSGKSGPKPNLAPSSLGIKAAVKPGLTKPGSFDRTRTGVGAAKLSIQAPGGNGKTASAIKKPANNAMFGSKLQDKRDGAGASVNVEKITTGVLKDITYITPKLVWQGVREPSAVLAKVQKQGATPDLDNQPEPGKIKEPGKAGLRYVVPKTPFLKEQGDRPDLDNQPDPGKIKEPGKADLRYVEPKLPSLKKSDKIALANDLQDEEAAADIINVEEISEGSLKDMTFITSKLVWQGVRETPSGESAVQQVNPQQGQPLSDVDNAPLRRGFDVR